MNWTELTPINLTNLNDLEVRIAAADAAVTSGKNTIAVAIVAMGQVTAVGTMTYAQLAALIQAISNDATALTTDVLPGKTFYQGGVKRTGNMTKYIGWQLASGRDGTAYAGRLYMYAPAGFYAGVDAPNGSLGVYFDDPEFIAANFPAIYNMFGLQGTMPVRGSEEYAGWRRADIYAAQNVSGRLHLRIPLGAYLTGTSEQQGLMGVFIDDADFIAANFPETANIFGLQGSIPYMLNRAGSGLTNGRHWATTLYTGGGIDIYLKVPYGFYPGTDEYVVYREANLVPSNLPYNVNILGVQGSRYDVSPGDNIASQVIPGTGDSGYLNTGATPVRVGSYFTVQVSGTYRVKFSIRGYYHVADSISYGRIYRNGAAYGTTRGADGTAWVTFVEDLFFNAGDTVEFWGWVYDHDGFEGFQYQNFHLCTAGAAAYIAA